MATKLKKPKMPTVTQIRTAAKKPAKRKKVTPPKKPLAKRKKLSKSTVKKYQVGESSDCKNWTPVAIFKSLERAKQYAVALGKNSKHYFRVTS